MKKILSVLCAICLLCVLALPVSAATGKALLQPSKQQLQVGDTFTVEVHLQDVGHVALCTIALEFDETVFSFTGGSCDVEGISLGKVLPEQKAATFLSAGLKDLSGKVFTLNMEVNKDAPLGKTEIRAKASVGAADYIDVEGAGVEIVAEKTDAPPVSTEATEPTQSESKPAETVEPTQSVETTQPTGSSFLGGIIDNLDPAPTTEAATDPQPQQPAQTEESENSLWVWAIAACSAVALGVLALILKKKEEC